MTKRYRLLGPDGEYESLTKGVLGGNGKAKIYGRLDCPSALLALKQGDTYRSHRVFFADETTAISSRHRPCGNCMKPEYRAWKATQ